MCTGCDIIMPCDAVLAAGLQKCPPQRLLDWKKSIYRLNFYRNQSQIEKWWNCLFFNLENHPKVFSRLIFRLNFEVAVCVVKIWTTDWFLDWFLDWFFDWFFKEVFVCRVWGDGWKAIIVQRWLESHEVVGGQGGWRARIWIYGWRVHLFFFSLQLIKVLKPSGRGSHGKERAQRWAQENAYPKPGFGAFGGCVNEPSETFRSVFCFSVWSLHAPRQNPSHWWCWAGGTGKLSQSPSGCEWDFAFQLQWSQRGIQQGMQRVFWIEGKLFSGHEGHPYRQACSSYNDLVHPHEKA